MGEYRQGSNALPPPPLRVLSAHVQNMPDVRDGDLARLRNLPELGFLLIANNGSLTPAALDAIGHQPALHSVSLSGDGPCDAWLARLSAFPSLNTVMIGQYAIEDESLAKLAAAAGVRELRLIKCPLASELAVTPLQAMPQLKSLVLSQQDVGPLLLVKLSACQNLRSLTLSHCALSPPTLATLSRLKNLDALLLTSQPVDDNLLAGVRPLSNLRLLELTDSPLPPELLSDMQAALPQCYIATGFARQDIWGPQRRAAEWALSQGAEVTISGYQRPEHSVEKMADVPTENFGVQTVRFGAEQAQFPGREVGMLRGSSVRILDLAGTGVGDEALYHLASLTRLTGLRLTGLPVTPAGLRQLEGLDHLETLELDDTAANDATAPLLAELANLQVLNLDGTSVTDEGLLRLGEAPKLTTLSLRRTAVTATGVEAFQKARPECEVHR
jgi:hypothetical protein